MVDIAVEVLTNLFQAFMFTGFLYFFFDKKFSKKLRIFGFSLCAFLMFATFTYFTFYKNYSNVSDIVYYFVLVELYAIIFLKGNIFTRLVMPAIVIMINTVISYFFSYSVSWFTGQTYYSLVTESGPYRNLCIVLINATNLLVLFVILKVKSKNFSLTNWTDVTAFIVIPILSVAIIYTTFYILILTNYRTDVLGFLIVICACMVVIAVIVWLMITRISRDNELKTRLLLLEQRENMYQNDVLRVNGQIEEMSKVKHDMKNNLLCISGLISNGEYEEAQGFCKSVTESLSGVYTPLNTQNPLLNAVVNVELEKAARLDICFSVLVNDEMPEFSHDSYIVSIIGNLCDNAIEYLQKIEPGKRKMKLEILRRNSYSIISCKNRIISSVLKDNPSLATSKDDSIGHGKGIDILNSNAKKYDGEYTASEKNGWFYASVVLKVPSLPKID